MLRFLQKTIDENIEVNTFLVFHLDNAHHYFFQVFQMEHPVFVIMI